MYTVVISFLFQIALDMVPISHLLISIFILASDVFYFHLAIEMVSLVLFHSTFQRYIPSMNLYVRRFGGRTLISFLLESSLTSVFYLFLLPWQPPPLSSSTPGNLSVGSWWVKWAVRCFFLSDTLRCHGNPPRVAALSRGNTLDRNQIIKPLYSIILYFPILAFNMVSISHLSTACAFPYIFEHQNPSQNYNIIFIGAATYRQLSATYFGAYTGWRGPHINNCLIGHSLLHFYSYYFYGTLTTLLSLFLRL